MSMVFRTTLQPAGDQPVAPKDFDDWSRAGACGADGGSVFMYWQRPKHYEMRECWNCRTMAFLPDDTCVGCRTLWEKRT